VLDTNVLSELMRPAPHPAVLAWTAAQPRSALYATTISKAEIFYGIAVLPEGRRRTLIAAAAEAIFEEDFAGRVFPLGADAAARYGDIAAKRRRAGRPMGILDAQIAAIALTAGAALATRNIEDFTGCDLALINPWEAQP
jgi:predicted nucleic acid-binding protein